MDEKILAVFKEREEHFVSGGELSRKLGISRSAVWKHIEKLREYGYVISAQPHFGYRLEAVPDKLLADEVSWHLGTKVIGSKIFSYETADSTNDIAYKLAQAGSAEGTVVFAEGQNKGRGRMGRVWASPKGKGIYMSLILRPDITPADVSKITLVIAVALCEAIRKVTGLPALIKWPNDVLVNDKKLCGVLIEMEGEQDKVNFLVVGIGVNVSGSNSDIPEGASSVTQELKKDVSKVELAKELLRQIEKEYSYFKKKGFGHTVEQWRNLSATLGRRVRAVYHDKRIEGEAIDINEHGALIIRLDNGFRHEVFAGDIIMLRK